MDSWLLISFLFHLIELEFCWDLFLRLRWGRFDLVVIIAEEDLGVSVLRLANDIEVILTVKQGNEHLSFLFATIHAKCPHENLFLIF